VGAIKIQAGDFDKGGGHRFWTIGFGGPRFQMKSGEIIPASALQSVELVTEGNAVRPRGAVGWGVAGALVAGPLGAAAGAIIGGYGTEKTFVAEFNDGRKFFGSTDVKTYGAIQASLFEQVQLQRLELITTYNKGSEVGSELTGSTTSRLPATASRYVRRNRTEAEEAEWQRQRFARLARRDGPLLVFLALALVVGLIILLNAR